MVHVAMDNTVVIEEISEYNFQMAKTKLLFQISTIIVESLKFSHKGNLNTDPIFLSTERLCMPWLDKAEAFAEPERVGELNGCLEGACALSEEELTLWKPLVLLIPLRLGLSDINGAYIETLKVSYFKTHIPWESERTFVVEVSAHDPLLL